MIHESTLEAVYPLAEKLASKGIKVTPLETTPIAQLCQAGHYPIPTRGIDPLPDAEERIMLGSKSTDASGACRHDIVMDEMVDVIADTVRNNLDMARNVINPIVKEVAQDVEEYLQDAETVHRTHVSVVPINYKPIWGSPVLSEMVARYSETAIKDVPLRIEIPHSAEKEALLELAKTGASRFDQEVEELFESLSEIGVAEAYQSVFGPAVGRARVLGDVLSAGEIVTHRGRLERALLVHLFARKLIQNPPEGVSMGLEEYRAYVADILSQSGRIIVGTMNRRENAIQRRQLVATWPPGRDRLGKDLIEIYVNGDVYHKWLEQGGEPEAIIGSFVSDQERGYTALLENKERYCKEWERQARVLGTTQRLNRFNHAVEGMRLAIAKQINEMPDEQLIVGREILHARLDDNLKRLYGHFYEDLYVYARMMVCKTLFPHTMGLKILCAIDAVAKDNPGIEVREAALLATIEIVATWVSKLFKVDRVTV